MSGKGDAPDFLYGISVAKILETLDDDDGKPPFFKEDERKEPDPAEGPELIYEPPPPKLSFGGDESVDPEFLQNLNTTPANLEENSRKNAPQGPDLSNITLSETFNKSRDR